MTSWHAEAVATPAPRTRTKPPRPKPGPASRPKPASKPTSAPKPRPAAKRRKHNRGAIAWIVVSAVLLAGVVFVNLGVLRLNLALDGATTERSKLRAENATLQSEFSRLQASPRLQSRARNQDGLVDADLATTRYIDLGK